MTTNIGSQLLRHDIEPILFHRAHLDELAAPGNQILDFADVTDRQRPNLGLHDGGVARQDSRIDLVGLGENAAGGGIAPDQERLANNHRQALLRSGDDKIVFSTACGLEDDSGRVISSDPAQQSPNTRPVIGDGEMQLRLMNHDVELVFADIDSDINGCFSVLRHCLQTSALLNSGSWAHSTVRDKQ